MQNIFRVSLRKCFGLGKSFALTVSGFIFIMSLLGWIFEVSSLQNVLIGLFTSISYALVTGLLLWVTLPLLVYIISLFYPVKIDPESIRASTYSGIKATLKLNDLSIARNSPVYGVPYLVLEDKHGKSIWIAEVLENQSELYSLLLECTKVSNPSFHANFSSYLNAK